MSFDYYNILSIVFILSLISIYNARIHSWALNDKEFDAYLSKHPSLNKNQQALLLRRYRVYTSWWFMPVALLFAPLFVIMAKNNKNNNKNTHILPKNVENMLARIAFKNSPILAVTTTLIIIILESIRKWISHLLETIGKITHITSIASLATIFAINPSYGHMKSNQSLENKVKTSIYRVIANRVKLPNLK